VANRRTFVKELGHACVGLAAAGATVGALGAPAQLVEENHGKVAGKQRILLVGLVGSENPTRANFPFAWSVALAQAGHDVHIELAGDATVLMRTPVSNSVTPVGWPPLRETFAKVIELKIPIHV
jgi:hypothetical protein